METVLKLKRGKEERPQSGAPHAAKAVTLEFCQYVP